MILHANLSRPTLLVDKEPPAFANSMIELGLLSAMVLVLVGSLLLLKRRPVQADRA